MGNRIKTQDSGGLPVLEKMLKQVQHDLLLKKQKNRPGITGAVLTIECKRSVRLPGNDLTPFSFLMISYHKCLHKTLSTAGSYV